MTPELTQRLSELRAHVEAELLQAVQLSEDCPERLASSMQYSLLAGGKRLRPILVLLACEACGGNWEEALPAACALEMIHTYSLIHDDLPAMDDDDLRRGKPTCHIQFDESTAILAGDALLTLAFEHLVTQIQPAETAVACCADLANAAGAVGMVGGQQADLEGETRGIQSVEHLEAIHRRKTGRLLCSALTMGGRIAGANADILQSLTTYGTAIGLAFQIADDLLDVIGDEAAMGKAVRKDADHGKMTYPAILGIEESRQRAERLVAEACAAIESLGPKAGPLVEIAHYTISRNH
ncbi:MAG: polyprenyl synthetase family protein [Planctomycetaceae bacterium]